MDSLITMLTGPGGLLVALLVILFTGMKGYWIFGREAQEIREDRDEWKRQAQRATNIGERVVTAHEKEADDARTSSS